MKYRIKSSNSGEYIFFEGSDIIELEEIPEPVKEDPANDGQSILIVRGWFASKTGGCPLTDAEIEKLLAAGLDPTRLK